MEDTESLVTEKASSLVSMEKKGIKRIPILVELRYYKTSLLDLIQEFLEQHEIRLQREEIECLLREGNCLLLFDGVNELPSDDAYRELTRFRHDYKYIPMIFTTRQLGLRGDLGIEKKLTMEPLTESQMNEFVTVYLGEDDGKTMLKQLGSRLKEFGETPLLLWMLCLVFVANKGTIPNNLGSVFQQFTNIYDNQLKIDVTTQSNSRILWKDSLAYLGFEMTKRLDKPVINKTEAEGIIRAFLQQGEEVSSLSRTRLWLEDLLNFHLLQKRGQNEIEFRHQLIQEYYAAEYLLKILKELTDEDLKCQYLNYLKWTEPMALMLGLLTDEKQAIRVVKLALEVDYQLGARLAGEVKQQFQEQTVGLILGLNLPIYYETLLLDRTLSEAAINPLINALQYQDSILSTVALYALGQIGNDAAMIALIKQLNNPNFITASDGDTLNSIIKALESIQNKLKYYQPPPPLPPKLLENTSKNQTVNTINITGDNVNIGNVANEVKGNQNTEKND